MDAEQKIPTTTIQVTQDTQKLLKVLGALSGKTYEQMIVQKFKGDFDKLTRLEFVLPNKYEQLTTNNEDILYEPDNTTSPDDTTSKYGGSYEEIRNNEK